MKIHTIVGLTAMTMIAGTFGCSSSSQGSSVTSDETSGAEHGGQCGHHGGGHDAMQGDMRGMCPMAVEGTQVTSADVEGGAAFVFTTSTGDVAELRRRVAHMAEMHARHAGCPMGGATPMPEASATPEEIESGARLVLRPVDPANVEQVQAHVREHAAQMASGECPMMRHGEGAGHEGHEGHGGCGMGHGGHEGPH